MLTGTQKSWTKFGSWLILLPLVSFVSTARGERLPIKAYTVADGLAHNVINKIARDSRGFLWFCTDDGLARFDGYTFTNFGTRAIGWQNGHG